MLTRLRYLTARGFSCALATRGRRAGVAARAGLRTVSPVGSIRKLIVVHEKPTALPMDFCRRFFAVMPLPFATVQFSGGVKAVKMPADAGCSPRSALVSAQHLALARRSPCASRRQSRPPADCGERSRRRHRWRSCRRSTVLSNTSRISSSDHMSGLRDGAKPSRIPGVEALPGTLGRCPSSADAADDGQANATRQRPDVDPAGVGCWPLMQRGPAVRRRFPANVTRRGRFRPGLHAESARNETKCSLPPSVARRFPLPPGFAEIQAGAEAEFADA